MQVLGRIDPATTAVIFDNTAESGSSAEYSTDGDIRLVSYSPNRLEYECNVPDGGGLAVFSEIHYPAGWKAYVDGKETEILRADYVLRALRLEGNAGKIEFVFDPESFRTGRNISLASSLLIVLALAGCLAFSISDYRKKYRPLEK